MRTHIAKLDQELRWSENIFTGENIKYTLYINNILLYFTTLYIIKTHSRSPVCIKKKTNVTIQKIYKKGHKRNSDTQSQQDTHYIHYTAPVGKKNLQGILRYHHK